MPNTLAERLAAVAELRTDVETKLRDAEALALESGGKGSRSRGAQLSRQDAVVYRRQLGLLSDLEAWLRASQPQTIPAVERRPVASGRPALQPANPDASEADRAPTASQRAPAFVEESERR